MVPAGVVLILGEVHGGCPKCRKGFTRDVITKTNIPSTRQRKRMTWGLEADPSGMSTRKKTTGGDG